jgi:hypothetical protein
MHCIGLQFATAAIVHKKPVIATNERRTKSIAFPPLDDPFKRNAIIAETNLSNDKVASLETVNEFSFCRFFGLFQEILRPFVGGLYQLSYITPNKRIQNLRKILKKATKPKSVNSLLV